MMKGNMMKIERLAGAIADAVTSGKNGETFDLNGDVMKERRGYWVGGGTPPITMKANSSYNEIKEKITQWLTYIGDAEISYVGFWIDEENNRLFVDSCTLIYENNAAMELGRERGEIAIYDVARKESLYVV